MVDDGMGTIITLGRVDARAGDGVAGCGGMGVQTMMDVKNCCSEAGRRERRDASSRATLALFEEAPTEEEVPPRRWERPNRRRRPLEDGGGRDCRRFLTRATAKGSYTNQVRKIAE